MLPKLQKFYSIYVFLCLQFVTLSVGVTACWSVIGPQEERDSVLIKRMGILRSEI